MTAEGRVQTPEKPPCDCGDQPSTSCPAFLWDRVQAWPYACCQSAPTEVRTPDTCTWPDTDCWENGPAAPAVVTAPAGVPSANAASMSAPVDG